MIPQPEPDQRTIDLTGALLGNLMNRMEADLAVIDYHMRGVESVDPELITAALASIRLSAEKALSAVMIVGQSLLLPEEYEMQQTSPDDFAKECTNRLDAAYENVGYDRDGEIKLLKETFEEICPGITDSDMSIAHDAANFLKQYPQN